MAQPSPEQAMQLAQQEMDYRVELFNKYKEGDLNVGENSCVDRCASKYWQVTGIVGQMLADRPGFSSSEDASVDLGASYGDENLGQQQEPPRALWWVPCREDEDQLISGALNVGALAFAGAALVAHIASQDSSLWDLYQHSVNTNPIATKAAISGVVYSLGDIMAQSYEGRSVGEWDRARVLRSGLCGFIAHGPLSHIYYLALDSWFAHMTLPNSEWVTPVLKMGVDQTAWSLFWNSTYYVLLGVLKLESPATIAATVRNTWWDLLKAGWRLWPFVHIVTYGLLPVQHRLLFVDAVELVWVTILSVYGQQQRHALEEAGVVPVACALPGPDGEGGDAAEEILRGMQVEHQVVFEDAQGHKEVLQAEELYGHK
ncbi:hypothetical protein N2152v2_011159 [Parachlorella kessleri]